MERQTLKEQSQNVILDICILACPMACVTSPLLFLQQEKAEKAKTQQWSLDP